MAADKIKKLDCFVGREEVIGLEIGVPSEILGGVLVTVLNERGDVLVEITDHSRKVRVGQHDALDVVQLRTGESFSIDGTECFVLRPYQVQVSQKTNELNFKLPAPRITPSRSDTVGYRRLLPALAAFAMLLGVCALFGGEHQSVAEEHTWPDYPEHKGSEQANLQEKPFEDELTEAAPATTTTPSVEEQDLNKNAPVQTPAGVRPKSRPATATKELWHEYQEYALEAKFDPQSARRKLQLLQSRVPKGSRLGALIAADLRDK